MRGEGDELQMRIVRRVKRFSWFAVIAVILLISPRVSADTMLDVAIGRESLHFSRDALLARPDIVTVEIAADVAYGKAMRFRAIPLRVLLAGLNAPADSVIETVASDGFAAHLPLDLIVNTDPAKPVAWLAIEPADAPWPPLPFKTTSAGPFYVVWTGAAAATIRSEQWPYQIVKIESQPSPIARWAALGVDPALPATHTVRAGQALFVTQCLPCHRLNGAGSSNVGPDMNNPMSPAEYMTPGGLHALIRDPKSVRNWPGLLMPAFSADQMSEGEIDKVIEYLAHMAARRTLQ